jgi:very-short-patch-repair endonuclease
VRIVAGAADAPKTPNSPTSRARSLRNAGTTAENRLWYFVRNRNLGGFKFSRQVPIGPYFADFVCRQAGLIVEVDGGQHDSSKSDERRTAFLVAQGYSVLRFWNTEVIENRDAVCQAILDVIAGNPSPDLRFTQADLSPTGRGTRGRRAASASLAALQKSEIAKQPQTVPLPVGERSVAQQPGEGTATKDRS